MKNIRYAFSWLALVVVTMTRGLAQSNYEPYSFATLAGGGGFSAQDMPGSAVRLSIPAGVAVDGAGSVYVTDTFNHVIRKLTLVGTNWVVTTLAGLPGSFGSADGTGSDARFYYPVRLAIDSTGNVFASDGENHTIRKITPQGALRRTPLQ